MGYLFAVVDASVDGLYDLIVETGQHACLFGGKLDPGVVRASPHLVRLQDESKLAQAWGREGVGQNWGIKCIADASFGDVRRHFRNLLQIELPDGQVGLFRFWDPRVWRVYLPTCSPPDLQQWFSAVDEYLCEAPNASGTLSYSMRDGLLHISGPS